MVEGDLSAVDVEPRGAGAGRAFRARRSPSTAASGPAQSIDAAAQLEAGERRCRGSRCGARAARALRPCSRRASPSRSPRGRRASSARAGSRPTRCRASTVGVPSTSKPSTFAWKRRHRQGEERIAGVVGLPRSAFSGPSQSLMSGIPGCWSRTLTLPPSRFDRVGGVVDHDRGARRVGADLEAVDVDSAVGDRGVAASGPSWSRSAGSSRSRRGRARRRSGCRGSPRAPSRRSPRPFFPVEPRAPNGTAVTCPPIPNRCRR